jgi:hypothetical protein
MKATASNNVNNWQLKKMKKRSYKNGTLPGNKKIMLFNNFGTNLISTEFSGYSNKSRPSKSFNET